ncbi:protoheme IX farnesyltransferase [Candidatus Kaiserbacteria bacterium]|nr:protoheme IX farnesyltransferase [Candidatus Kaiserbacteria bacterium]
MKSPTADALSTIRAYTTLTKPGIILGNIITALAGFFLASQGTIDIGLLCAMLAGLSLVVASGCVLNNVYDRDIDALMERTRSRALARGLIPVHYAIAFSAMVGLLGAWILFAYTNPLTLAVAVFGFFMYTVVYTLWAKRHTSYGTLIGSVSGAMPPVIGYVAVTGSLDAAAYLLCIILVLWQLPHFYAIGLYRLKDYTAAKIPILPVTRGVLATKLQIMLYISEFIVVTTLLTLFGYTGFFYLTIMLLLGFTWLGLSLRGFQSADTRVWARRMFFFSLVVIVMFAVMIVLDKYTI